MEIIAHGIDLIRCDRIGRIWHDHGERFLARVYTPAEQKYCLNCKTPVIRLSGRFAAKEAVLKVLGTGWRGEIRWTDVETLANPLGQPVVTLHGEAAIRAESLGIRRVLVSISHTDENAVASAIGLGG